MKKIIYMILVFGICFIALNFKPVYAEIKSDKVMSMKCTISKNCPEDSNCWENEEDDYTIFMRYTDNEAKGFMSTKNFPGAFANVPNYVWITGGLNIKSGAKKLDTKEAFDSGYCPESISSAYSTDSLIEKIKDMLLNPLSFAENLYDTYKYSEFAFNNEGANIAFHDKIAGSEVSKLEHLRYVIYKYIDDDDEEHKIAEGYTPKGEYAYVGPDIILFAKDEITGHQQKLANNTRYVGPTKYFKVDEVYASRLIAGNGVTGDYSVCEGKSEESCINGENHYEILAASSGEGRTRITDKVSEWFKTEGNEQLSAYNNIIKISKDTNFINTCEEIEEANNNSKEYDFSKINIDDFINKLSEGKNALSEAYDVYFKDCGSELETSVTSSITSCAVYSELLGINEIVQIAEEKTSENMLNEGFIVEGIYSDVTDSLKEVLKNGGYDINIVDASRDLNNYTKLFYTAALYLKSKGELTETQKDKLDTIIDEYKALVEDKKLGISPVVDCQTLLGEDLINKIKSYVNIIKIAIPIILIGLGIFDFTKAMFSGEEEMQNAKKNFIKRILIAVLIFITPTILHFILSLANEVWEVISPDSCGIF